MRKHAAEPYLERTRRKHSGIRRPGAKVRVQVKGKKVVTTTPGDIGAFVANGGAELGVSQMQDFVRNAGVEIAGPLW